MFGSLAGYAWPAILALGAAGAAIGAVGGLLGIGGGVIAVPVLLEVFAATSVPDPLRLPISVGTSHLVVALAAAPAVWGHARAGTLDRAILRAWTPALLALPAMIVAPVAARLLRRTGTQRCARCSSRHCC